jgi:uncharacterized membrane protein
LSTGDATGVGTVHSVRGVDHYGFTGMPDVLPTAAARRYERDSLEFERIAFFSDAVFAIALTLLVTGLDVPSIAHEQSNSELWQALNDQQPRILMFFISVAVIGSFWLAHHRYVRHLTAFDRPTAYMNLAYLGLVAFVPFPSAVLGEYSDNAVGVSFYAITIALVATAGTLLDELSYHRHLHDGEPPPGAMWWRLMNSAVPVAVFLLSIAVAFGLSPGLALFSWLLTIPAARIVDRLTPSDLRTFFAR